MLNVCAVLIELCLPFCKGDLTKLGKIDASYSASAACRLNYDFENCLAGGQISTYETLCTLIDRIDFLLDSFTRRGTESGVEKHKNFVECSAYLMRCLFQRKRETGKQEPAAG